MPKKGAKHTLGPLFLCTDNSFASGTAMTHKYSKSTYEKTAARELKNPTAALISRIAAEFIQSGRGIGEFIDIAKFEFCAAAEIHIAERGGRLTTSRIALLTGLSRSNVAQLRKRGRPTNTSRYLRPRHLRVIDGWKSDPTYLDQNGKPAPLTIRGKTSFESLSKKYSGDIPVRAVLDELLASNFAAMSPEKKIVVLQNS